MILALGLALLVMVFFFWILSQPSRIERLVQNTITVRNTEPLVEELTARPEELQARALDQMMNRLLEESEPELAIRLAEGYLLAEKKSPAGHRWVKTLLEREPVLSRQYFRAGFLEESYNPNMAAHCGPGG
ncbi:MAG: hypothetical protein VX278_06515 [Myxococcota bacterium]|nr:hypothetical protein [Myxococcota bacterium]